MAKDNIQEQINEINRKLDIVLEEVMAQRETRQSIEDLTTDLTIVGKDVFKSTVTELDNAGVEIDGEAVKQLMLKMVRNVDTLNEMFEMLESANDLVKDVTPILHQMGLDGIHLMNEFEQKGYFEFMKEAMKIIDMLKAINSGLVVYKSIEIDNVEEYSIWRAMKAMNSKEMKKGIGFMITFLQNIAKETEKVKINS